MLKNGDKIPNNQMLASLNYEEQASILPYLNLIPLDMGERLNDRGERIKYAYFLTSGIISFLYIMENGESAGIGIVGREGFCGIPVLFGGDSMLYDVVVLHRGEAYRISVNKLRELFNSSVRFRDNLLLFCQTFLTQVSQTAVCNRHHSIEQQLCRWLLLLLDRTDDNYLNMTQEIIAAMLGVRREGVSEAARRLRDANIIAYHRGRIEVIDRPRLEQQCCECYGVIKQENGHLFQRINASDNSLYIYSNKRIRAV